MHRRDAITTGLAGAAAIMGLPHGLLARPKGPSGLDVALGAAKWISTARYEAKDGAAGWALDPRRPGGVDSTLYNGMPGVVLFFLELHKATGDARWLAEARAGADHMMTFFDGHRGKDWYGLYTGLAGDAWVMEETHRATGAGKYRDAARRSVRTIRERAQKSGAGAAWPAGSSAYDIVSGSAGIGLFLLWAEREMKEKDARETAVAAGRHLLSVGKPAAGGTKWGISASGPRMYPNFSHGTAGVAYFLASLYQATGDKTFLDGALAGVRYLEAIADRRNGGFKVFHSEPGNEYLHYMAWCHGPAGTSRLFYRLALATQDDRWLEHVKRGARATIDTGLPEERTPGFWNNVGQCCGNCGVGEWFLALRRIAPSAEGDRMIARIAADTLTRATTDKDGMRWVQAEHRVRPDLLIAQTGWMQGAAGVGAFFLHRDNPKDAIIWPDSPFGELL